MNDNEETSTPEIVEETSSNDVSKSILNSVKKLLGLLPETKEFDADILMNINAAIFTLQQIGIGSSEQLFIVEDETQTYEIFLGEDTNKLESQVKMYLYYKTKLAFDPPQNGSLFESLKEMIKEAEWRLNTEVETFIPYIESEEPTISDEPEETPPVEKNPP